MRIKSFFDKDTATFTYIIIDEETKHCAVIDPVLDYNMSSGKISTTSADQIIEYVKTNDLHLEWILETHIHADHLTAADYLKQKLGGKIGIGKNVLEILKFWTEIFNTKSDVALDGSQFDHLFLDAENFKIGNQIVKVFFTSGHTPSCVSYLINDAVFVGDALLMPRLGTARCDFPGGSAAELFNSIQKIYSLPSHTKIFTCHDYPAASELETSQSTVGDHKKMNVLLNENTSQEQYIESRNSRDRGKEMPKLLLPALQINIRAGKLPTPEENSIQYLKIPLNKF
jgi:glyoxylase-like metal-dependent hydrolase (beta-lactamase superfamily II)